MRPEVVRVNPIGVEVPRDTNEPAPGQVASGYHQRPSELLGLFASAQVTEGAHTQVTQQTGQQLLEIGPSVHPVGQQQRQSPADQRDVTDQIAVQELPVIDGMISPSRVRGSPAVCKPPPATRRSRPRWSRDTGKLVSSRAQRVHRPDQPDTPNTTAFTHQIHRVHNRALPIGHTKCGFPGITAKV